MGPLRYSFLAVSMATPGTMEASINAAEWHYIGLQMADAASQTVVIAGLPGSSSATTQTAQEAAGIAAAGQGLAAGVAAAGFSMGPAAASVLAGVVGLSVGALLMRWWVKTAAAAEAAAPFPGARMAPEAPVEAVPPAAEAPGVQLAAFLPPPVAGAPLVLPAPLPLPALLGPRALLALPAPAPLAVPGPSALPPAAAPPPELPPAPAAPGPPALPAPSPPAGLSAATAAAATGLAKEPAAAPQCRHAVAAGAGLSLGGERERLGQACMVVGLGVAVLASSAALGCLLLRRSGRLAACHSQRLVGAAAPPRQAATRFEEPASLPPPPCLLAAGGLATAELLAPRPQRAVLLLPPLPPVVSTRLLLLPRLCPPAAAAQCSAGPPQALGGGRRLAALPLAPPPPAQRLLALALSQQRQEDEPEQLRQVEQHPLANVDVEFSVLRASPRGPAGPRGRCTETCVIDGVVRPPRPSASSRIFRVLPRQ